MYRHGAGGNILTFRDARLYKIANAFMLAHPYGFPQVGVQSQQKSRASTEEFLGNE